jgi:hypothetical protein
MKCKKALKGEMSSAKVTSFFMKSGSKSDDAVLAAEGAFAFHSMKHHSSYKTADCMSVLFKIIFPDSEIARRFSSAQTKTEAIVNSVIAPHAIENIKQVFTNNTVSYCGVATDASNHNAAEVFPVVIQYFDWKNGGLQSKLIEMQQQ